MENSYFTEASIVSSDRILYTPSDFARSSLLHLQEIGTLQALRPHVSSRTNLSSYLFFIVLSGSGTLTYFNETYSLKTGDCVFIDCSHPYSHTTSEENLWSLRWCHFYGPTLPSVYGKYAERGGRPAFTPQDTEPFTSLLEDLYDLASGNDYIRDMKINEKLNSLLTCLMSESWHPEHAGSSVYKRSSVSSVKEYLDLHYAEKITLDQLSREFYINKFYLTRVFKEQYGMPVNTYLRNLRITHAKQLLRFTDQSIEEIGIQCGMPQLHYFSRVFKEVEGISPSTYRNQWD